MAPTGESGAWVAPGVHVGSATQVLDPGGIHDHETVSNGHIREWVALAGVNATGEGNVFFYVHAYIVQQNHT